MNGIGARVSYLAIALGLASAPGTPTGAHLATRAVRRQGSECDEASRRLPIFARLAKEQ